MGTAMGNFGEDLRMERLSRGIKLEEITAITKISHQYLVALEQEKFRHLPGGILSKGILRGYTSAVGLDQNDWMERFLRAQVAAGQISEDESGWTAFAANVGKSRIERRDVRQFRLRWAGALVLLLAVSLAAFFTLRFFGLRAGWWSAMLPGHKLGLIADQIAHATRAVFAHVTAWFRD